MNSRMNLHRTQPLHLGFLLMLVLLALTACSTVKDYVMPSGVKLDWESVTLSIAAGANRDYPIAVDVVLVSDEALAQRLLGMSARDWFSARSGLRKTYPDVLSVDSLELAPGESLTLPGKRWSGRRVAAALVFADYLVAGPHLARIDSLRGRVQLAFGANEFTVYSLEK
jgi:type VI secretion system protein